MAAAPLQIPPVSQASVKAALKGAWKAVYSPQNPSKWWLRVFTIVLLIIWTFFWTLTRTPTNVTFISRDVLSIDHQPTVSELVLLSTLLPLGFVALFGSIIVVQSRRKVESIWVAAAALLEVSLLLGTFALAYRLAGNWTTGNFKNLALTHPDALYVAVGSLTTLGFSDLHPLDNHHADFVRLILVFQMCFDFAVILIIGTIVTHRLTRNR